MTYLPQLHTNLAISGNLARLLAGFYIVGTEEAFTISVQVYFYPCPEEEWSIMVELSAGFSSTFKLLAENCVS